MSRPDCTEQKQIAQARADGEIVLPENPLITPHRNYLCLGNSALERQNTYRSLVESGVSQELVKSIRSATNGNFVLGDERFSREMEFALNRRVLRGQPGRPGGVKK